MTIGPVQMIVLGFQQPDFRGAIIAELERLRASDTVKVIDLVELGLVSAEESKRLQGFETASVKAS